MMPVKSEQERLRRNWSSAEQIVDRISLNIEDNRRTVLTCWFASKCSTEKRERMDYGRQ